MGNETCNVSVVVPVRDEEGTVSELTSRVRRAVEDTAEIANFEIIFVDDGSSDSSWSIIERTATTSDGSVRGIRFRRNAGKAAALEAGFAEARYEFVFTMDGDLQDDPKEIPRFLAKINEGFDLVSGWKRRRFDPISKTAPSRIFNRVTALVTGVALHDFNCGFKCYRKEVIDLMRVYGELHRYIPVLAHDLGFRIGEIEVDHHKREQGVSKYGWERYVRGFLDLITVVAITRWLTKPGHLFGTVGVLFAVLGGGILAYLAGLWFAGVRPIGDRPLLLFGVMFCILSVQMISLGIIGELLIRSRNPRHSSVFIQRRVPPESADKANAETKEAV